ncbi:unnamed protein product [Closterium sp. NIES-54]
MLGAGAGRWRMRWHWHPRFALALVVGVRGGAGRWRLHLALVATCRGATGQRTGMMTTSANRATLVFAACFPLVATFPTCTHLLSTTTAMASPTVLTLDAEGRAVDFDVWVDDLQPFLQCDSRDGVSLFDHTSGVSTASAATAYSTVHSQWTTRDAVAHLAVRSHLPPAERVHFGQYKTAQSLYDAVVAR